LAQVINPPLTAALCFGAVHLLVSLFVCLSLCH